MSLLIGMDEAGYGPNLGPLVITASVWEIPDEPVDFDIWAALSDVVSQEPIKEPKDPEDIVRKVQVGDSKDVYSPAKGIAELEKSVQTILGLLECDPYNFRELVGFLSPDIEIEEEPWFHEKDLELPLSKTKSELIDEIIEKWKKLSDKTGVRLKQIRSEIVLTRRYNELLEEHASKGVMLSRTSLGLLRSVWEPDSDEKIRIVCDKHGGRNRYNELLYEILDGQMLFCVEESRARSSYRTGNSTIQFSMKAESHFPVAVSSMVCKYIRELSMELFNDFWKSHVEGLRPTKGYPADARRFRAEVAEAQKHLEIPDEEFWRNK